MNGIRTFANDVEAKSFSIISVSYTHLDVYKRQIFIWMRKIGIRIVSK